MPIKKQLGRPLKLKLKRVELIRVMVSPDEMSELQRAADMAGAALSVFVRMTALEAARRREKAA